MAQRIVVIDGHDGSGKTTLTTLIARRYGGVVARPFTGTVAQEFTRCFNADLFDELNRITLDAVQACLQAYQTVELLVFDRHWLTMLSVLPESLHNRWLPHPATVMTWADPETTYKRLCARGETVRNSLEYHEQYCAVFRELAHRHSIPVIDTGRLTEEEALHTVKQLAEQLLAPDTKGDC